MNEKYPVPTNLATPRMQKINHPWNRGYPNNRRVARAFGEMAKKQTAVEAGSAQAEKSAAKFMDDLVCDSVKPLKSLVPLAILALMCLTAWAQEPTPEPVTPRTNRSDVITPATVIATNTAPATNVVTAATSTPPSTNAIPKGPALYGARTMPGPTDIYSLVKPTLTLTNGYWRSEWPAGDLDAFLNQVIDYSWELGVRQGSQRTALEFMRQRLGETAPEDPAQTVGRVVEKAVSERKEFRANGGKQ